MPHASLAVRGAWSLASVLALAGAEASFAADPPGTAVYKCRGDDATPVYQEAPCAAGRELRDFTTDPGSVSVIPFGQPSPPEATSRTVKPARATRTRAPEDRARPVVAKGDPSERRHLREGMSQAEVVARIGQPDVTSGNKGSRELRWSWLPAAGDPQTMTTVRFADGRVVAVERKVLR